VRIAFDDGAETGRALGHDLYLLSRVAVSPEFPASVREGFEQAHVRRLPRSVSDRFVRKWLQLRRNCAAGGRESRRRAVSRAGRSAGRARAIARRHEARDFRKDAKRLLSNSVSVSLRERTYSSDCKRQGRESNPRTPA
jgi:hypothetical protein